MEATHADRPIPLISFVARQRDLRELVGETLAAGSVQTQFNDSLRHWEARFEVIKLEDRNLPAIAEQRVLRPVSAEAKRTLDDAFRKLLDARRDVLEILQTDEADREMFRKLYPFSPALVGNAGGGVLGAAARAHGAEVDDAVVGGSAGRTRGWAGHRCR